MIPSFSSFSSRRSQAMLAYSLLIVAGFALVIVSSRVKAAGGERTTVTYVPGVLQVSVPYTAAQAGPGKLVLDVLDPEDAVVGHAERTVTAGTGRGVWRETIRLAKALPIDDVVWHRLRYRFVAHDPKAAPFEGIESISTVLLRPVVHVRAQQSYASGAAAAMRILVTDSQNEPLQGGTVRMELGGKTLFRGTLNARGTVEAQVRFPARLVGAQTLRYIAETPIGTTEVTQAVTLEDRLQILLTTEKPLYQPGQRIHVRALVLDRTSHEAAAGRTLTFELDDSRGNKVMKAATKTSPFGVASTEFPLADEVNLGTYHLRALLGDGGSNKSELALNVEKYVLPKFKVAVEFTGKAKHGYRPGDTVSGVVRANYFFGKSVPGSVDLKLTGADAGMFVAGTAQGHTDADGAFRFAVKLPDYFAGRPLQQGATRLLLEATVKDSAGHSETRGEPVTVSQSPIVITAVPEGGTLIPEMENQVFVLTAYADGQPAKTKVRVKLDGNAEQTASTGADGVAMVRLRPSSGKLNVEASDADGNRAAAQIQLDARNGGDQILLRVEKAVVGAGERIPLRVFSTKASGAAYIDVIKDGQTILTRDVDLVNGQASLDLTATPALAGTVDVNAYLFGRDAIAVADHRLLFVQPATDLKIEATADRPVYEPGAEARIRFKVTNGKGQGVQAALGLQVVDEAVFALAEKQPGFAKVFFYLEQEVMKPRYEIHSIGMPEVLSRNGSDSDEGWNLAARALFAATDTVRRNAFTAEAGRVVPMTRQADYSARYAKSLGEIVRKNAAALGKAYDARKGDLSGEQLLDPWGKAMMVDRVSGDVYRFQSGGSDKTLNSGDDLYVMARVMTRLERRQPSMTLNIEHERGPFNGKAEIGGAVVDALRGAVGGITVKVRAAGQRAEYTVRTDGQGAFQLTSLPPGEYTLEVAGSSLSERKIVLSARDRAVVLVELGTQRFDHVAVLDGAVSRRNRMFIGDDARGVVGGVPGGIGGGVIGGIIGGPRAAMMEARPVMMMREDLPVEAKKISLAAPASSDKGTTEVRVRSYFPEALFIHPQIVTDDRGEASIVIPMADSITTWRMAMMASTRQGALGSAVSSLKVFRDFFADLDMPVTLTQGDRVSIPVAVYNYSGTNGTVELKLEAADWYGLAGDVGQKSVQANSGEVKGAQFTIEARRIGKFPLKLTARMPGRADVVVREIEVVPNGRELTKVINGRLDAAAQHEMVFPAEAITDASKLFVRLYPGPLSQVVEGMDAILRMPYGCFEQTSSATYPNVLSLDYMKKSKKLTPEVRAKAEGFITTGYQRLLTYEVAGGGFSWFGQAPANKILTSYGLMEFFDMAKVHDVDARVIARTQQWLAGQQQGDGSWKPDQSFINEGATNRYNSDVVRITAYIGWALSSTNYNGPAVEKARQYVMQKMDAKLDVYTQAVIANFAASGRDRNFTQRAVAQLTASRKEEGDHVWWDAQETAVYATGQSAAVETTGLAVQALLNAGMENGVARKALAYLASKKDANGTWGTTQATIMALRALLLSMDKGAADVQGTVEISLNGQTVETLALHAGNNDLFHQFVLKGVQAQGVNRVGLRFQGKGGMAFQIAGRYFVPWSQREEREALSIAVSYDRTTMAQDDLATATAVARNNLRTTANMVMIDLGIPPGFDLLSEDLQAMQQRTANQKGGRLEKFTQTATQAILYFDSIPAGGMVTVKYRLRAKYPLRARTPQSRVYAYYDPSMQALSRPIALEVRKK